MKNKYRVIYSDNQYGYIPQIKYWWFPIFWLQLGCIAYLKADSAIEYINKIKFKKYL